MKQIIRLTESDLHRLVRESVRNILKESGHEGWREEDWNPNYPSDDDEDDGLDRNNPLDKYKEWEEDNL